MERPLAVVVFFLTMSGASLQSRGSNEQTTTYFNWAPTDSSPEWGTFTAKRLPRRPNGDIDQRYLPALGNGRLAFVPFSPTIHMANLFTGRGRQSHLADIPAMGAFDLDFDNMDTADRSESYTLNVEKGYFEKLIEIHRFRLELRLRIYTCAESASRGLIIHEVSMNRGSYKGPIYLVTKMVDSNRSADFRIEREAIGLRNIKVLATLIEPEAEVSHGPHLYMYYTYPHSISMRPDEQRLLLNFIMAIGSTENEARTNYEFAKELDPGRLLALHSNEWMSMWRRSNIEIDGNHQLMKLTTSAMYYLMTSLPESKQRSDVVGAGVGVGVHGLINSANTSLSNGHVTWEQEKWMLPIALAFYPDRARTLLQYRSERLGPATAIAAKFGWKGAKYPWESTESGKDVTPTDCDLCRGIENCQVCDDVIRYGDHVSADIAYAARQYLSVSRDRSWLARDNGVAMLRGIAEYYASRAQFNQELKAYEIKDVMGPDVYSIANGRSTFVSNSLYTNMGAAIAIETANYAACLEGSNPSSIPHAWLSVARNLRYPFNEELGAFEPYDGYDGEKLVFPSPITANYFITHNLSRNITKLLRANNLEEFLPVIDESASGAVWSEVVKSFLDVGNKTGADYYFPKVHSGFVKQPFWVWTETRNDLDWRSSNHVPSMSALILTLIYGYAGMRITPNYLEFNPQMPPDTTRFVLNGLRYKGATFDLVLKSSAQKSEEMVSILMTDNPMSGDFVIRVGGRRDQVKLELGVEEIFSRQPFTLKWLDHGKQHCDPPRDPSIQFHSLTTQTRKDSPSYSFSSATSSLRTTVASTIFLSALIVILFS